MAELPLAMSTSGVAVAGQFCLVEKCPPCCWGWQRGKPPQQEAGGAQAPGAPPPPPTASCACACVSWRPLSYCVPTLQAGVKTMLINSRSQVSCCLVTKFHSGGGGTGTNGVSFPLVVALIYRSWLFALLL